VDLDCRLCGSISDWSVCARRHFASVFGTPKVYIDGRVHAGGKCFNRPSHPLAALSRLMQALSHDLYVMRAQWGNDLHVGERGLQSTTH
jgi:hypothetical protein